MDTSVTARRHLITSALPYINGVKHLGNLVGSMLPADVYARYLRARGQSVLLICATDEHGTPAELAAAEAGLDVAEYCRIQHDVQAALGAAFSLSFDWFGRTSSPQNHELTQYFARRLAERGLLEERTTRQVYSPHDGRFLPDRYVTGTCPYCGSTSARGDQCESCTRVLEPTDLIAPHSSISGSQDLEVRETRHLFFKLPELAAPLRAWIESHEEWPAVTTSIGLKWLDEGLQDRGITRDLKWGVPVDRPGFENKVFYVWFDAPIAYIASTKEWADQDEGNRDWRAWWFDAQNVEYTQFMAKDNVPFHTIMFPAVLMGTGEPWKQPDFIKAFNWLTYQGGKFSTSAHRGVFMSDAIELIEGDYWRYALLANAPESNDADFTWELFAATVNKDLAGVFGNFVNRVFKFIESRFGGAVPDGGTPGQAELEMFDALRARLDALEDSLSGRSFRKSIQELRATWSIGNAYFAAAQPWKLVDSDPAAAAMTMRVAANLTRYFAAIAEPFVPVSSGKVYQVLGLTGGRWPSRDIASELTQLAPGHAIAKLDPLFRTITDADVEAWQARFTGAAASQPSAPR